MLFLSFDSQQERRIFGGSCFLELQYCRLPQGTPLKKLVSLRKIRYWQDDSLYVYADSEDLDIFFSEYGDIFSNSTYDVDESGIFDLFGINYYSPEQVHAIIGRIAANKPTDGEILIKWLKSAESTNGLYLLGI